MKEQGIDELRAIIRDLNLKPDGYRYRYLQAAWNYCGSFPFAIGFPLEEGVEVEELFSVKHKGKGEQE